MKKATIFFCSVLAFIPEANAFDNQREGFLIGLGLGLGSQTLEISYGSYSPISEDYSTFNTSFKIGYGFNENFTLYFANYVNWYDIQYYDFNNRLMSESMVSGVRGLGATYFFNEGDSFYLSGAIGQGYIASRDFGDSETGEGGLLSVGYEWKNGLSIEAVLMLNTKIRSKFDPNLQLDTTSQQLLIQYTFY